MKIPEVISELQQVEELIQELNAKTPHMALKKLRNERQQCKERTEQLQAVLEALGCSNNWRNAVARAQTLMKGQQETPLPMWLQTVSPAWDGKVPESRWKYWLSFCQNQYRLIIEDMDGALADGSYDQEDYDARKESLCTAYIEWLPEEFIDMIARQIKAWHVDDYGGD